MPASPTVASNRGPLYDIQTEFGLTSPDLRNPSTRAVKTRSISRAPTAATRPAAASTCSCPTTNSTRGTAISIATTLGQRAGRQLHRRRPRLRRAKPLVRRPTGVRQRPVVQPQAAIRPDRADQAQFFNDRGQDEKYFLSTNGSNPANGGFYVLMPTDKLYAWNGVSLATTLAPAPVADFTQAALLDVLGLGQCL